MTEQEVFISSEHALTSVVDQISDEQWGMALPEWFQVSSSQDRASLDLKKIINYHAYDDAWVPGVLAGKTPAEIGDKYDGDLLGVDPKHSWHQIVDAAIAPVEALSEADLEKVAHLSYGDFPIREYLKHITIFRAFRAFDIAKLIGISTTLPDDFVQALWDQLQPDVEQWRTMGVFGPAIVVPEDAPLQDRLMGLVGRDPH